MASISDRQTQENKEFKDYVMTEYVDFFRTKNRFNREWRKHTEETVEMISRAKAEMKGYEGKVIALMQA